MPPIENVRVTAQYAYGSSYHTKEVNRDLTPGPQERHGCESHEAFKGHLLTESACLRAARVAPWSSSYRNILLGLCDTPSDTCTSHLQVAILLLHVTTIPSLYIRLFIDLRLARIIRWSRHTGQCLPARQHKWK